MALAKRVVYISGIGGRIGRALVDGLKTEYDLRGCSLEGTPLEGARVAKGNVADLGFMESELQGVDTLIHLAADPSTSAGWDSILPNNLDGTYKAYEAARRAGVRRIIFASSNHVTGILTERGQEMDPSVPIRPDSLYGVSKAFGEALGRFFSDRYGLSILNFRIGWQTDPRPDAEIVEYFKKHSGPGPLMWLSTSDSVEAFRCGIEAPDSVKYGIYYIMSNNRDSLWDLSAAEEIGFRPKDDLGELFDRYGEPYSFRTRS